MDEKPKRRWFCFKLSTILILTAILARAMACRSTLCVMYSFEQGDMNVIGTPAMVLDELWSIAFSVMSGDGPEGFGTAIQLGPNPELLWPALALSAFLAWKSAWAVVECRHAQRETRCNDSTRGVAGLTPLSAGD